MAYVSGQWNVISPGPAGAPSIWLGYGTDIHTSVGGVTDFVSDGVAKGMRVNDVVIYVKTTATVGATLHVCTALSTAGATVSAAILA